MFASRITEENGNIVVWIDKDDLICIKQPHKPGLDTNAVWESEAEAQSWADQHIAQLDAIEAANVEAQAKIEEDSIKLSEIHAMLTELLNK